MKAVLDTAPIILPVLFSHQLLKILGVIEVYNKCNNVGGDTAEVHKPFLQRSFGQVQHEE